MSDDLTERLRADSIWGQSVQDILVDWMKQRKQAAARIEELEAKLLSATMDGYDMAKHEYRDRIEELEAKLAKAVEALQQLVIEYDEVDLAYNEPKSMTAAYGVALDTLAELRGQKDGWKCPINYPNCEQNCGNYGCGN